MEYSVSATKQLFWFVETRETARLLANHSWEEVRQIVIDDNVYQQKSQDRLKNEFGYIKKRLEALPEDLRHMLIMSDINTGKLVAFVGCMASDRLLFDLMYEMYRKKLYLGEEHVTDADLNIFFKDKQDQNDKVAAITDGSIKKLKQVYSRYLIEAGLLSDSSKKWTIIRPYIDPDLASALKYNAMNKYLVTLTGER